MNGLVKQDDHSTEALANALQIEVKKDSLRQNQDGTFKLTLTMHRDDLKDAPVPLVQSMIMSDPGTRYMLFLVELEDDGTPKLILPPGTAPQIREPRHEAPTPTGKRGWHQLGRSEQAGILCGDPRFQNWITSKIKAYYPKLTVDDPGYAAEANECAKLAVYELCGITSRAQLPDRNKGQADPDGVGRAWDEISGEYRLKFGLETEDFGR